MHTRAYQLAYDMAKRAEQAYRHELGLDASDFIRFGHWDGLRRGLTGLLITRSMYAQQVLNVCSTLVFVLVAARVHRAGRFR